MNMMSTNQEYLLSLSLLCTFTALVTSFVLFVHIHQHMCDIQLMKH